MKVKEIVETFSWDHSNQFLSPKSRDIHWHHELENKPKEHIYIIQDKKGKTIRSGLSHKAAVHLKDRQDLIKKYGPLRIVKVA